MEKSFSMSGLVQRERAFEKGPPFPPKGRWLVEIELMAGAGVGRTPRESGGPRRGALPSSAFLEAAKTLTEESCFFFF